MCMRVRISLNEEGCFLRESQPDFKNFAPHFALRIAFSLSSPVLFVFPPSLLTPYSRHLLPTSSSSNSSLGSLLHPTTTFTKVKTSRYLILCAPLLNDPVMEQPRFRPDQTKEPVVIDLTKIIDENLLIYTETDSGYSDPAYRKTEWASIPHHGFAVQKLDLGTQTGTHVDAPCHMIENAPTVEQLNIADFMGDYLLVEVADDGVSTVHGKFMDRNGDTVFEHGSDHSVMGSESMITTRQQRFEFLIDTLFSNQKLIFIRKKSGAKTAYIHEQDLYKLLQLKPKVWIIATMVHVGFHPNSKVSIENQKDPIFFNRTLARFGKWLVEDLDEIKAEALPVQGEIVALPMNLKGTSGAPCRVIAKF